MRLFSPCPHQIIDDVCWLCSVKKRGPFPVSEPWLTLTEQRALLDTFTSGRITHGPVVVDFEAALARYTGTAHAVACSSGTTALHLALEAIGITPNTGAEVLVPDVSFVATANAVVMAGMTPVLCDIQPHTWAIDLEDAARKVSSRTVAIIPVHLYGRDPHMPSMREFADLHGLMVIEDAAEGFCNGTSIGKFSDAAVLSFYGNKIITTGEGGAVLTNDDTLRKRIAHLRGQAQTSRRFYHDAVGYNYRMSSLHAAIGLAQLERIDEILERRRDLFNTYAASFAKLGDMRRRNKSYDAPWLYTLLVPPGHDRDAIMATLSEHGIETRPTFVPMHQLPMYERPDAQFPVATDFGRHGLSLPTFPTLTTSDAQMIAGCVTQIIRSRSPLATEPNAGAAHD